MLRDSLFALQILFPKQAASADALNDLLCLRAFLHPGKKQKLIGVFQSSVLNVI